jgi:hypothetical protein
MASLCIVVASWGREMIRQCATLSLSGAGVELARRRALRGSPHCQRLPRRPAVRTRPFAVESQPSVGRLHINHWISVPGNTCPAAGHLKADVGVGEDRSWFAGCGRSNRARHAAAARSYRWLYGEKLCTSSAHQNYTSISPPPHDFSGIHTKNSRVVNIFGESR